MKQIILKMTAVNWQNNVIEGPVTTARTSLHLQSVERAHAQLHLSRVTLTVYLAKIFRQGSKTENTLS